MQMSTSAVDTRLDTRKISIWLRESADDPFADSSSGHGLRWSRWTLQTVLQVLDQFSTFPLQIDHKRKSAVDETRFYGAGLGLQLTRAFL